MSKLTQARIVCWQGILDAFPSPVRRLDAHAERDELSDDDFCSISCDLLFCQGREKPRALTAFMLLHPFRLPLEASPVSQAGRRAWSPLSVNRP